MLATAGSHNQTWVGGTKGGSGVSRALGGILGQKPELEHAHVPKRRCGSFWWCHLRPREGGWNTLDFSFLLISSLLIVNYQRPKLIRNQKTWKASKCSPEKAALRLHSSTFLTPPLPHCYSYKILIIILLTWQSQSPSISSSIHQTVLLLK